MISKQKILLTGITGAVGSWIAGEAVSHGVSISALMRDENAENARERVTHVLDITGTDKYYGNIDIVKGDIRDAIPGISDPGVSDISMIFHCAACMNFSDNNKGQSFLTNIEGTKNILKLASKLRVPICYISTAYVAGKRNGVAKESETDIGQTFNNVYERTKCNAEMLVHEWASDTGLPAFVFRPSIVIGDSKRGRIATFNGIYSVLRFFDTIGLIVADNEEIRAVGKADATKNLIPVDYLAKAVWHIVKHGSADTYHITNPNPLTLGQLRDICAEIFGIKGELVSEEEFQSKEPTRAELLYRKASSLYEPYMAAEPIFDRSNTDAVLKGSGIKMPVIDGVYFARLLEYAKSVHWRKVRVGRTVARNKTISVIEKYFDDFLVKKLHKQLLPDLRKLSATFRIVMKEEPEMYWLLAIEKGALTSISRNGAECECSFVIDSSTFGDIVSARVSPQKAFFKKQVAIKGNIETGLKLVAVLAVFFKKHPFNIGIRSRKSETNLV